MDSGMKIFNIRRIVSMLFLMIGGISSLGQLPAPVMQEIDRNVNKAIQEGKIPGLCMIIEKDGHKLIKYYGYADLESRTPIDAGTGFELGSCSKAFTALAILQLARNKKINLQDDIRRYLPWLAPTYKAQPQVITVEQLLHHTSGIPWSTIAGIPPGNSSNMLESTVRTLQHIALENRPGEQFEYTTINYDVLGLLIEKVTGRSYEQYMMEQVFAPLGMRNTAPLALAGNLKIASGYKTGFFTAQRFTGPSFRGNTPAGYLISNGPDITQWLSYQLGTLNSQLDSLITVSHHRNESVAPYNVASYGLGWFISLEGNGHIFHSGLNPGFSSFIGFSKQHRVGVAILCNINGDYPSVLGTWVLDYLSGKSEKPDWAAAKSNDHFYSLIAISMAVYLCMLVGFFLWGVISIFSGRRQFSRPDAKTGLRLLGGMMMLAALFFGVYKLPAAISDFTWPAAVLWTPVSFPVMIILLAAAMALTYLTFAFISLFPAKNKYIQAGPPLIILSLVSGIANMLLILLITSAINSGIDTGYLLLYFALIFLLYIAGRKIVQTSLTKLTAGIVHDLRVKLIGKIFSTSYQRFEKIDNGRLYATLNNDTSTLGASANIIISLTTSVITVVAAFVYLSAIAFWATGITLLTVTTIAFIYYWAGRKANRSFEAARTIANTYMRFLNRLIDGFKELSIHRSKKRLFQHDIDKVCTDFRDKTVHGQIKFINAFLIGEMLLIIVLAFVAIVLPLMFSDIKEQGQLKFVIVLLYLIGPVNAILNAVPQFMQIRIARNRIGDFLHDIPSDMNTDPQVGKMGDYPRTIEKYCVEDVSFHYSAENENGFALDAVSFELKRGEVLFIIGGNGSGKTTLSKVLTGLYAPDEGRILVNGHPVDRQKLGEFFSVVFNPLCLFDKQYTEDPEANTALIDEFLKLLKLESKVSVNEQGEYSTTKLSSGQRKRLALLECYLEDRPVYLFDEWAVDQDPEFRRIFYRELIPRMKEKGKIIIAITHDDQYFDVADQILRLDQGKMEPLFRWEGSDLYLKG
jgi:putative pyoverdin transport system ATP-binding/permease protein